jgi:hypothetical protein
MKKPTPNQTFHISRLVLFSLLAVALLVARGDSGNALRLTYNKNVLAYASNMTIADLLKETNAARVANNLQPLTLSNTLDTSAQLKANDMVDNNYWSHVAPDGTQPWHWFEQAGYTYDVAGENLAYGFSNGTEVSTAWMNSPSHKANVLGDYVDIGFGIASSANFQGGENTVVVAHYGKPRVTEAVAQTAAPTGTLSSTTASSTSTSTTIFEFLKHGQAPLIASVSIGLVAIAAAGFALSHRAFMKHAFRNGKKFAVHHPLIDATVVLSTIGIILSTTVGHLL